MNKVINFVGNGSHGVASVSVNKVITVNSLMFTSDLFGDFRDHIKFAKINSRKHNSGTLIINRT